MRYLTPKITKESQKEMVLRTAFVTLVVFQISL